MKMTPIEKIKEGILSNDMEQIVQGFMALTGEEIRPEGDPNPGPAKKSEEPKPERAAEETVQPESQTLPNAPSKNLDFSVKPKDREANGRRTAKTEKIVIGENQFVDDGVEDKDIVTPDVPLTPRNRVPSKTIKVACHICNKAYEISAQLLQGQFYRCDNCVGKT
tara:strand:+ start:332 stop:826 length:495 start_codon:yes stop_codon:yes gene_type:complete